MRPNDLGTLIDLRMYRALWARSTHTPADIAKIEQDTGLVYVGSFDDDGYLIPLFAHPTRG